VTLKLEVELRTTVASLRVKTSCQKLLIMAPLPNLGAAQKAAAHGRLDAMGRRGGPVPARQSRPG
jgi:hypothetical protein